jgi:hypothetical protein
MGDKSGSGMTALEVGMTIPSNAGETAHAEVQGPGALGAQNVAIHVVDPQTAAHAQDDTRLAEVLIEGQNVSQGGGLNGAGAQGQVVVGDAKAAVAQDQGLPSAVAQDQGQVTTGGGKKSVAGVQPATAARTQGHKGGGSGKKR